MCSLSWAGYASAGRENWEGREWDRVRWVNGGMCRLANGVRAAPASFSGGVLSLNDRGVAMNDRWMARVGIGNAD
jgi:hypothetical protein